MVKLAEDGMTMCCVTHEMGFARTVADLAGKTLLDEDSLLEALQYRAQEKLDG